MSSMWDFITETPEEAAPLTADEQDVYDAIHKKLEESGEKMLPHEAIIRYVRGYSFEAKTGGKDKWRETSVAEAMKTVAWRKEVDADTLEQRSLPKWEIFKQAWPTGICGTDRAGHPILVERFQDFKLDLILANFKPEDLGIYVAKNLENLQRRKAKISRRTGKLVYKHIYILDCKGMGTDVLTARAHIQAIFGAVGVFYPETLLKSVMLHSPVVFRMLWGVVSPWIHPITREKIKVIGGKGLKEMKAIGVEEAQIPPSVSGTWAPDPEFERELVEELAALPPPHAGPNGEGQAESPKAVDLHAAVN